MMQFKELFKSIPFACQKIKSTSLWESEFAGQIKTDWSLVDPSDIFIAIRGSKFDSHIFLNQAAVKNPKVIISESSDSIDPNYKGAVIVVSSTRQVLALLASELYGNPSGRLACFGITGTNGKTSTTFIMQYLLQKMGFPTARIGTLGSFFGETEIAGTHTTPGPLELQFQIKFFADQGAKALVMEVSSHALEQYRVDGVMYDAVGFTNLTHDHLDYHLTMEKYFLAKSRLFTDLLNSSTKEPLLAVVNIDDPWGKKLLVTSKAKSLAFGKNAHHGLRYTLDKVTFEGTYFYLHDSFSKELFFIPIIGEHNVQNYLLALGILQFYQLSPKVASEFMKDFEGIPGRLQAVKNKNGVYVFIDYAHTPDALEKVLVTLKQIRNTMGAESTKIRLIFGCGGERDRAKRPIMASIAEHNSDRVYVTSDNPRGEDPGQIINEIVQGFKLASYEVVEDRRLAIQKALSDAKSGDVVLIAGKGHENYQEIKGVRHPFLDYHVAMKFFEDQMGGDR